MKFGCVFFLSLDLTTYARCSHFRCGSRRFDWILWDFFFRRCGHLHTRHLMNRYSLIGWFLKAVIGAFRRCVLSVVYSHKAILWLRFKIVGVRASGIFIPLSLLIFFRWSLSCIANFTWRVQHWVSISKNLHRFKAGIVCNCEHNVLIVDVYPVDLLARRKLSVCDGKNPIHIVISWWWWT